MKKFGRNKKNNTMRHLLVALTLTFAAVTPAVTFAEQTPAQAKQNGNITLDFENVELRDLIRFMAETTNRNFIVDPKVGGKVTIISPRPVPTGEALSIFEGLLAASGFAIVPNGPEVWRIIPSKQASQSPLDVIGVLNGGSPRPSQLITRLVRLKHVSAKSIMPALEPLLGSNSILSAYQPNNTLLLTDRAANVKRILKIIDELDHAADDRLRAIDIVYLRNADAPALAAVLNDMINGSDNESSSDNRLALAAFRGNVSVVADSSTNALLISAEPGDMDTLKDVIEKLDIRRLQVYLEALIMEVSSDAMNQFGIEWRATSTLSGDAGIAPFGGSTFGLGSNDLASNPLALPQGFSFGMSGGTISFRGQEYANIGMLVRALRSDNRINILSTPQLLTLDNEEAEIIVGDNVPFITGSYTSGSDGAANPFQTITREDVGLTLRIRPQIAENGMVRLNMYQEISSIAAQAGAADLITRKRSLKTTVMVPNDNMIALGGLIRDDVTSTNQEVPCLANFFGAGELFKSSATQNTKTNLMVFIRPRIINNFGYLDKLSRDKYLQLRDMQIKAPATGSKFVPQIKQQEPSVVPESWRAKPVEEESDATDDQAEDIIIEQEQNGAATFTTTTPRR